MRFEWFDRVRQLKEVERLSCGKIARKQVGEDDCCGFVWGFLGEQFGLLMLNCSEIFLDFSENPTVLRMPKSSQNTQHFSECQTVLKKPNSFQNFLFFTLTPHQSSPPPVFPTLPLHSIIFALNR
jgi:hypothetical protein